MDNNQNKIVEGVILESLPNTMFRVKLNTEVVVLTTLAGKLRRGFVRIFPGDRVRVEMTPYDTQRGRIVQKI